MIGYKNTDNEKKGFFFGKIIICIILMSALLLWLGNQNNLSAKSPVRVGILPFQVFSGEKVEYLKDVISTDLPQHLKAKEELTFVDQGEIKNVTGIKEGTGIFSPMDLYRIAELTGAQFLIYGSLTKIEDNLSIDVRVFTNLDNSSPYKNFVEGKDLDLLLKNVGGKISNQISKVILASSPPTPTPETPEELTPSPGTEIVQDKVSPPTPVREETPLVEAKGTPPEKEIEPSPEQLETSPMEPTSGASAEAPSQPSKKASAAKTSLLKPKALSSDQPVNITSDRMVADNRNRTVNFLGNVVAKREDMIIFSDQISAVYTEDGKIEKIISRGNVKINQTDRTATCQEATFFQLRQQIVMTGKPKVWQGKNIITGDKIIIFVKEDRVEVESDKQEGGKQGRVNAIIYPEGKGLKK